MKGDFSMKKINFRTLSFLLALVMVLALAACGQNEPASASSQATSPESSSQAAASEASSSQASSEASSEASS